MATKPKETEQKKTAETVFSKASLLQSRRYRACGDVLNALLEDGRDYSISDVDRLIMEFKTSKA